MTIKIKPNYDDNRNNLADVVPLNAPYTVVIEITRFCNFKCYYCMHSTRDDAEGSYNRIKLEKNNIDMTLFNRISKEITEMNPQPKRVLIQGLGEPLINKELPKTGIKNKKMQKNY